MDTLPLVWSSHVPEHHTSATWSRGGAQLLFSSKFTVEDNEVSSCALCDRNDLPQVYTSAFEGYDIALSDPPGQGIVGRKLNIANSKIALLRVGHPGHHALRQSS